MSTVTKVNDAVRTGIRRTIRDAVEVINPDAFLSRPAFPGAKTKFREPQPLVALAPAILAEMDARHAARQLAAQARADGASWHAIANAAGIGPNLPEHERGHRAWAWASGYERSAGTAHEDDGHGYGYDWSVCWRCDTCHRMVYDYGPDSGHPADAERGHDRDCARRRTNIDAYERQLDDDE